MPLVSVITRTRNRPDLLRRAARSLAQQTFRDLQWIVADDSTDAAAVEPALAEARRSGLAVRLCRVANPAGMESASNQGLALADTPYVTFLDDDDTWEPSFLAETVSFLDARGTFAGVCTQTSVVEETADRDPTALRKYVMNEDLESIQIADMMVFNHLTTNSLLYLRAVHDRLGPYREDLPVMGDWEFGIRLVTAYDIGVIAKPLANYHRRIGAGDAPAAYANTVTSLPGLHAETDARLRNELLRKEWAEGRIGPGHLMALARIQLRADRLNQFHFHDIRAALDRHLGPPPSRDIETTDRPVSRSPTSPRRWLRRLLGCDG